MMMTIVLVLVGGFLGFLIGYLMRSQRKIRCQDDADCNYVCTYNSKDGYSSCSAPDQEKRLAMKAEQAKYELALQKLGAEDKIKWRLDYIDRFNKLPKNQQKIQREKATSSPKYNPEFLWTPEEQKKLIDEDREKYPDLTIWKLIDGKNGKNGHVVKKIANDASAPISVAGIEQDHPPLPISLLE